MDGVIVAAGPEQEPVFAALMQLYVYDFSELLKLEIAEDGRFPFDRHRAYWTDARYQPFLIRTNGHLAGFVVVDGVSRLTEEPLWDMSQFFVLRKHRTAGIGARAAAAAFHAFPGRWEVRVEARNTPAQTFWRKVVNRYTGGHCSEIAWDDDRFHGVVFRFETT
jgi:predicted acetyltransferase